jgi:hypothetical protein
VLVPANYVERKRTPPPPKFGAMVGSFGSTLGGFDLLSVADNGRSLAGSRPRTQAASPISGAVLRQQVDPLPPFIAKTRELQRAAGMQAFEAPATTTNN